MICVQTLIKAFWCHQVVPIFYIIFKAKGKEETEKAIEDLSQVLKVLEEGIEKDFPEQNPFFNGESLGYLGIAIRSLGCNYKAVHEVMDAVLISLYNCASASNAVSPSPFMPSPFMVSEPAAFVLWLGTLTSHTGIKEGSPPTGHVLPL